MFPRPTYLRLLTGIQNTSALAFGTFLAVHLASPVVAAVAGGEGATRLMLLGREYYYPLEPVLVYGSISLHVAASFLRRLHLRRATPFRPTTHQLAGYVLIPFLSLHILTHRLIPSSPNPPINALSPSELGYSFVSYGLQTWPIVSWTTYAALILAGTYHALLGAPQALAWFRSKATRPPSKGTPRAVLRGAFIALVSVLGIGLARLHAEDPGFSRGMTRRLDAVYRAVPWVYR
ncbi:hypothetical protein NliqN6_1588 [Naganishia liquefaciens]|uniref:Mitochondrial adapter protein MCP1 transmembrane domain-containing protein n=1 Tax=Naganishia liquefaciens TaxID=104408 RepID=A0A8H3TPW7_9TREE|nr:hypothetical protein NliqN6_1588 [Naganishia liquefaciens]